MSFMATRAAGATTEDRIEYDTGLAGRKVRHAREDLRMSAAQLAQILTRRTPDVWSVNMIRNLESGRKTIDPPLLRVLSEELDRPAEYFLYQDPYNAMASLSRRIPRYLTEGSDATVIDSFLPRRMAQLGRQAHSAVPASV